MTERLARNGAADERRLAQCPFAVIDQPHRGLHRGGQCIIAVRNASQPRIMLNLQHRLLRPLLLAAGLTAVTGCGMLYKQPIYQGSLIEKNAVEQLQVGMSKQDVQVLLGTPSIADPFSKDRWDYTATQRVNRRGTTEIKNFVVWFENDAVTKWEGEYFPEQDDALAQKSRSQFGPNLPKDDKKRR
jgi:outer membrane protein assembly factor BamE